MPKAKRICPDCGSPSHKTKRSGLRCADCRNKWDRAWRARRKAAGSPVVSTQMPREYWDSRNAEYYARPEVKTRQANYQREYRTRTNVAPKVAARLQVRNAIRRGDLVKQACEVCGAISTHAHHNDYSKPLEVRWLCRFHHDQLHAQAESEE